MKKRVFFISIDIEGSGRYFRFNKSSSHYPHATEGDIIGIGACFTHYDEDTDKVELIDSLKIPLFRKCRAGTPPSDHVLVRLPDTEDEDGDSIAGNLAVVSIQEPFDYYEEITMDEWEHNDVSSEIRDASVFEQDTWNFWTNHLDILDQIAIPQESLRFTQCRISRELSAIKLLSEKRKEWETIAAASGSMPIIVTDTVSYDCGNIENMMHAYTPENFPLQFSMTETYEKSGLPKYMGGPVCTHSMQAGVLMIVDPVWWGRKKARHEPKSWTDRLRTLYGIPKPVISHDHNPENDAYTIACEYADIFRISIGKYTLKKELVEK